MRVLFASLASAGHTYPLVPLAIAARDAGHDVCYAAGEAMHHVLAAHALAPFRPADAFYEIYAEDLEPELARLEPDLVVHEWGLPGAAIAAHRAGIPGLWHGFGRMIPEGIGLELPTRIDGLPARPHLDICPPSFQDKDFLATADRVELRHVPFAEPIREPSWAAGRRARVYLTFGTVFATANLLATVIAGLSRLNVHVLVAAGPVHVPDIGELPGNVLVQKRLAQAHVLGKADLVVHHGGSGTMLGALAAGVPQLVLPQGADQFANAGALAAAGAGLRLLPEEQNADAVAEQAATVLRDSAYRDAARGLAAEIAAMPAPAEVARRLPEYARGRP